MDKKYIEERGWGRFEQFTLNEPVTVKLLFLEADKELHLQTHEQREEFWHVISGTPTIIIGEETFTAKTGDEFTIPKNIKHQIKSIGGPSCIMEISRGHFDEHDIIHY